MCERVKDEKNEHDKGFCKGVHVDKTILTGIPYFQKRLIKTQLGSEPEFLHPLSLVIQGPLIREEAKLSAFNVRLRSAR